MIRIFWTSYKHDFMAAFTVYPIFFAASCIGLKLIEKEEVETRRGVGYSKRGDENIKRKTLLAFQAP